MNEFQPRGETLKLGLLMETAQAHQRLSADVLAQLNEHVRTLGEMVRVQVTRAVVESLDGLREETNQTTRALRRLRRATDVRSVLCSGAAMMASAAIAVAVVHLEVPSARQIAALRTRRALLAEDVKRLHQYGAAVDVRRCGPNGKLCVRVRRHGPAYGPHGDFLLVKAP